MMPMNAMTTSFIQLMIVTILLNRQYKPQNTQNSLEANSQPRLKETSFLAEVSLCQPVCPLHVHN